MKITRETVEKAAAEMNMTVLDAITQMQAGAAIKGDEKALEALCEIKSDLLGLND